jgi:hypothetical protein
MLMGESDQAFGDDAWWDAKLSQAGYSETDAGYLKDGLKRRISRTYMNALIGELHAQVDIGLLSPADVRDALAEYNFAPDSIELIVARAERSWTTADAKEAVTSLKLQYSRDQISDDELSDGLTALGLREERVQRVVLAAKVARYKAVPLLTDDQETKAALGTYKAAFRSGLMTEDAYSAALFAAGMTGEVEDLTLAVDKAARQRQQAAEIRQYQLPALRDQVVDGTLSVDAYRTKLAELDFPEDLRAAEIALATALANRRKLARVQSIDLPTYERSYVRGLIQWDAVERVEKEAGRTDAEITDRKKLLTDLQKTEKAATVKKTAATKAAAESAAKAVARAEWGFVSGSMDAANLLQAYKDNAIGPAAAATRIKALQPLRLA